MILHHFTLTDRVDQIMRDGLTPSYDRHEMLGGAEVVWLTEKTVLRATPSERRAIYFRSGQLYRSWMYNTIEDQVSRLSIRIPSHDRKLFKYHLWLRKHSRPGMPYPYDEVMLHNGMTAHWIYFGEIPPSAIVAVDKDRSNFTEAEALTPENAAAIAAAMNAGLTAAAQIGEAVS
jgi:hypothetical protein